MELQSLAAPDESAVYGTPRRGRWPPTGKRSVPWNAFAPAVASIIGRSAPGEPCGLRDRLGVSVSLSPGGMFFGQDIPQDL